VRVIIVKLPHQVNHGIIHLGISTIREFDLKVDFIV